MNTDKQNMIKVTEEFVTPYGTKVWIGVEKQIIQSVDEDSQFQNALHQVRSWGELATQTSYQSHNPSGEGILPHRIEDIQTDKPVEINPVGLEKDIMAETCLRKPDGTGGLLSWATFVKRNPSLQPAYDKRMKELQSQQ